MHYCISSYFNLKENIHENWEGIFSKSKGNIKIFGEALKNTHASSWNMVTNCTWDLVCQIKEKEVDEHFPVSVKQNKDNIIQVALNV